MKLELRHLYYSGNGMIKLNDINLTLTSNEFLSVFFESSDSKDGFIKSLLGSNYIKSGNIYIDSINVTTFSPRDRRCAYVSKEPLLKRNLTLYDNVALPLRKTRMKEEDIEKRVDSVFKDLNMEYLKGVMPDEISLYQSLKISLARAIIFNPTVIILDDPLSLVDESRYEEYISYIKDIYNYLDNPIIIYLDRITELTNRILSIDKNGCVIDNARKEIVEKYPVGNLTMDLLNLPHRELLNKNTYTISASIKDETLYYSERNLNLNKLILKNIFHPESLHHILLKREYFDFTDKGNSLKFMMNEIKREDNLMVISTKDFTLYKLYNDDYVKGQFVYYPLDKVEYYDDEGNLISSSLELSNNEIDVKVSNGIRGLIEISGKYYYLNKKIPKGMKHIEIDRLYMNSLSNKKNSGLYIERIANMEEFKDFYILEVKIKGNNKLFTVSVDKSLNPLKEEKLYLVLNEKSFKISNYI